MPNATLVRERPILFSGAMVRALLDGRKTQTRRVLKVQPLDVLPMSGDQRGRMWVSLLQREPEARGGTFRCRYGAPGDRLWVREAWTAQLEWPGEYHGRRLHWWHEVPDGFRGVKNAQRVYYQADGSEYEVRDFGDGTYDLAHNCDGVDDVPRWRPSIHMPRWVCRLVLELTDVRVERLQEIREDDACAEGVTIEPYMWRPLGSKGPHRHNDAVHAYQCLWDSLNAKRGYGWDANPWVWALTFRRVEAQSDA